MARWQGQKWFTLIELVVVLVLTGILAGLASRFITAPIEAYVAVSRRAELVGIAEIAMTRLARDVAQALPNSLRIGCDGRCVELLHVVAGGRYRSAPPGDVLSFNPADADQRFAVIGPLEPAEPRSRVTIRPIAAPGVRPVSPSTTAPLHRLSWGQRLGWRQHRHLAGHRDRALAHPFRQRWVRRGAASFSGPFARAAFLPGGRPPEVPV